MTVRRRSLAKTGAIGCLAVVGCIAIVVGVYALQIWNDNRFENNFYYIPNENPVFSVDDRHLTFAQWQGPDRDQEGGLLSQNPFVDVKNKPTAEQPKAVGLTLVEKTPAEGSGLDLSSAFTVDFLGKPRIGAFDIGAYNVHERNPPRCSTIPLWTNYKPSN